MIGGSLYFVCVKALIELVLLLDVLSVSICIVCGVVYPRFRVYCWLRFGVFGS